jgi:hypothetical protein
VVDDDIKLTRSEESPVEEEPLATG